MIDTATSAVGRPAKDEADPYYFGYVDRVPGEDVVAVLGAQLDETVAFLSSIGEERSRFRYAEDKWSLREVLGHLNDVERLMTFRAFWFARGLEGPLPSYEEDAAARCAGADALPWARHVEEFRAIRLSSLALFRNLPKDAWDRRGTASGYPFSVRALAYIVAGHLLHHSAVIRERYV